MNRVSYNITDYLGNNVASTSSINDARHLACISALENNVAYISIIRFEPTPQGRKLIIDRFETVSVAKNGSFYAVNHESIYEPTYRINPVTGKKMIDKR